MKNVTFQKLTIVNFLSVGKEPIIIDFKKGIHIITGQNLDKNSDGNGVGKSTIVDAFFFSIFGETLRNLKKEEIVNKVYKKGCVVALEFEVNKNGTVTHYKIERGIGPSKCDIYVNHAEKPENLSTIPACNEYILNLLNSTQAVFRNTVTTGINNSIPFMSQKKNEKREFIEGILRLEVFKIMNSLAKDKYTDFTKEYTFAVKSHDEVVAAIKNHETSKGAFECDRTVNINSLRVRWDRISDQIKAYEKELIVINMDDRTKLENDLNQTKIAYKHSEDLKSEMASGISKTESQIEAARDKAAKALVDIKTLKTEYDKYPKFEGSVKSVEDCESMKSELEVKKSLLQKENINLERDVNDLHKTIRTVKEVGSFCDKCKRPYADNDIKANEQKISDCKAEIDAKDKKQIENMKTADQYTMMIKKLNIMIQIMKLNNEKKLAESTLQTLASIDSRKEDYQKICEKRQQLFEMMQSLQESLREFDVKLKHNQQIQELIKKYKDDLAVCVQDIEKQKNAPNPYATLIDECEKKKTSLEQSLESYKEKIAIYDVIKFAVSDEGVKSFIVKKLLNILNERINYYLIKMDANCTLTFDEYFEDKIVNDRGAECSYFNFSGGERKRIDLACLFAFMDLRRVQGDVSFNVTFYDELLDSAISVQCAEKVFEILKERMDKNGENSYIITHRKENWKNHQISDIIFLEKSGGTTKLSKNP